MFAVFVMKLNEVDVMFTIHK